MHPALAHLLRSLDERGFDVVGLTNSGRAAATQPGHHRDVRLVVVGHGGRWWDLLLDALTSDASLRADPDPVDTFTEMLVEQALDELRERFPAASNWRARYGHHPSPPDLQGLAAAAGLVSLGPAGICAHPELGPWCSLRAVIETELPAVPSGAVAAGPCEGCHAPCLPALEDALRRFPVREGMTRLPLAGWRAYLGARDACPVGRASRFTEDQLEYHYTHDRAAIDRALRRRESPRRGP